MGDPGRMERGSQGNGINKSQGMEKAKGALDASKDAQQQNGAFSWLSPLKGNKEEIKEEATEAGSNDKSMVWNRKRGVDDGSQVTNDARNGGYVMPRGYFCK